MPTLDNALPIIATLPALRAALTEHNTVLLQAPPGAGKSTVTPTALLDAPWLEGSRIIMLEPRRLAARAVAERMASLRRERVGETVGYRVRFEQRVGPKTRVEVVTEGILTRRLQQDTALEGVGLIIFDEFHERSLQADLALALCRDIQHALREDLRILIMSATLDSAALLSALGPTPVVTAEGRQFPVEHIYALRDPFGALPAVVADGVARALNETHGDVLAFLPGAAEIQRAQQMLACTHPDVLFLPLYGDLNLDAQQAAIVPDPEGRRKVVLATSVAETSLTIDGVRTVVDSGFARVPRFDARSGLTRLETVRVTRDSADQRAGRAGRQAPGRCYRLWSEDTQRKLLAVRKPEILEADLAGLRLELAQWGARDATALRWVTNPPPGALRQASELLEQLGALRDGMLTPHGRALQRWPTHPRLAHLLETAHPRERLLAADVAALLDERDPFPRDAGTDLSARVDALRAWRDTGRARDGADSRLLSRIDRIAAQWLAEYGLGSADRRGGSARVDPYDVGRLVSRAYPERIAQRRGAGERYKLANGRGATLPPADALAASEWLAIAQLDGGSALQPAEGRVYLAAPLSLDDLAARIVSVDVVTWDARQGALIAEHQRKIDALVVSSKRLTAADNRAVSVSRAAALCAAVREEGLELLDWPAAARQFQARVCSLRAWNGADWPDLSDAALLAALDSWLPAWLDGVSRRPDFKRIDMHSVLQSMLPFGQQQMLAQLAPTHVDVPSGNALRIEYALDGAPPVLAVKLQEMFGLADTPVINQGKTRLLLHLLSPARRPIQVTQDLRSFWHNTYPEVRKELRARYVKHPWPEDPWNATPTSRTVKGSRR